MFQTMYIPNLLRKRTNLWTYQNGDFQSSAQMNEPPKKRGHKSFSEDQERIRKKQKKGVFLSGHISLLSGMRTNFETQ